LDHPVGIIIQKEKFFNFNDLVKNFSFWIIIPTGW
jgi:hypothetical protein